MKRKFDWVLFGFVLAFLPYRLGAEEGWKPLFNGKDLSRWEHVGPGSFVVEDGMLKTVGGMGLLWYTREKIGNSVLRVVYKATHREDNAGVFIRISDAPPDEWFAVHNGYEVQIFGATSPEHAERPLAHHRFHLFHLEGYLEALKTRGRMEYDRDYSGWAADAGDVKRRKGERFSRGRPDTASKKLVRATTSPASGGRLHRHTESPRRRGGLLQGGPGKTSRKVNQADRSHFQPSTLILHFSMTHTTARFQAEVL